MVKLERIELASDKYPNLDSWKDDFLVREHISGLELMVMDEERRTWLYKFPQIFVPAMNSDGLVNLLHPKNKFNAPRS